MKIQFSIILMVLSVLSCWGQVDNNQSLKLGDHYGGGIIFSIDDMGQHGLISAPNDQSDKTCWGNEGDPQAVYLDNGSLNTEKIVSFLRTRVKMLCDAPAALICDTLNMGGFSDWFLPSINELKFVYAKQGIIGGFVAGGYWSSTEEDFYSSWSVIFTPNSKEITKKYWKIKKLSVRCIRKF